jgi:UDP-N-acetylglucosamine 2-epimerase (hydrolysing)
LTAAKKKYEIPFKDYCIFIYHPVTTELEDLESNIKNILKTIAVMDDNYVVIYPNNDPGSDIIIKQIEKLRNNDRFKIFPSIRFEHYLSLLKNSNYIIGNSSAGIREAGVYGIPAINIGSRQRNRSKRRGLINVSARKTEIIEGIKKAKKMRLKPNFEFGSGKCAHRLYKALSTQKIWKTSTQKYFVDI